MWSTCDCGFDFFYSNSAVLAWLFFRLLFALHFHRSLRFSNWYCTLKCHFVTNMAMRQPNGAKTMEKGKENKKRNTGSERGSEKQQKQHRIKWNVYVHGKMEQENVKKCSNTKVWNVMLFRCLRRGLKSHSVSWYSMYELPWLLFSWTLNSMPSIRLCFMQLDSMHRLIYM